MIDRTVRIIVSLATCLVLSACGQEPPPVKTADEAFVWFNGLGFPDVRDRDYVLVTPAQPFHYGLALTTNRESLPAFLLRDDERTFTVFTLDLYELTFDHTGRGGRENPKAHYERLSFSDAADAYLERLRSSVRFEQPMGSRLSERAEGFVLAWACWRQGLGARSTMRPWTES